MSAAERKAVGERMRTYWAARKEARQYRPTRVHWSVITSSGNKPQQSCFVATPFGGVWDAYYQEIYAREEAIRQLVSEGYRPAMAEDAVAVSVRRAGTSS